MRTEGEWLDNPVITEGLPTARLSDLVACALHGTPEAPRQGPAPTPGSPAAYLLDAVRRVEATFSFTEDGLTTRVVVE